MSARFLEGATILDNTRTGLRPSIRSRITRISALACARERKCTVAACMDLGRSG